MRTKAVIARKMRVPSSEVWEAVRGIGGLDVWFPSIASCRVDGDGVGARRSMTMEGGGEITDEVVDVDSTLRRLRYERTESPFPVSSYRGTVEVFESFDSLAVIVWTVDFESEPEVGPAVARALEAGIGAGVEGMDEDLARRRRIAR
jgi:Polyketide cyclase / dehydrase and lipid transport